MWRVRHIAITGAIAYSLMANLVWWHSLLLVVGCLFAACAIVFSFLEVRRSGQNARSSASETFNQDPDAYASRTVDVAPPTGEAYPHHRGLHGKPRV